MSEVSEALERAEHTEHAKHAGHAEHGGGHGPSGGRAMGLTMAVLGVLLAFCAAIVGSERTELIKTMVEQSNTNAGYQAESTRYRTTLAQVEALNSVTPQEESSIDKMLAAVGADAKPENADVVAAIRAAVRVQLTQGRASIRDTISRLVHLARAHQKTAEAAKKWTESFEPVVRAHYEAAEGFERAQVVVEVAIVLASIALLLFRKSVWGLSVLVGAGGIALMVLAYTKTHGEIHEGEEKIEVAHKAYDKQIEETQKEGDEEVLAEMEKDFKLEEPAKPE